MGRHHRIVNACSAQNRVKYRHSTGKGRRTALLMRVESDDNILGQA